MNNGTQYEKDLAFIEKTDKLLARNVVFFAYFFAFVACMIAHTLYLVLYAMAGVRAMVIFNIFSVLFYAVSIFLVKKVRDPLNLVYCAIAEIELHAIAATVCVGLLPNFIMFMLMVITLAFLMPNKTMFKPFAVLFISVPVYGFLYYYYTYKATPVYDISDSPFRTVFYVINIIIGSAVLIYIAIIFTHMNRYLEARLRVQNEQLRVMASTDPLTRLNNRREINRKLEDAYSLSCKDDSTFVIGIGDIDDFKKVNDRFGHDTGDVVLTKVAAIITDVLPDGASASRWGGEEFLFVLPGASIEEARKYSDDILSRIRETRFTSDGNDFSITMTIGICEGGRDSKIEEMINTADDRLYKGKNSGKDHTEFS